jgi:hypothetical protein
VLLKQTLTTVLDALAPHTSPGGAFIDIGNTATHYDLRAVYLETFARPLWGLTSLLIGGDDYSGVERWINGFKNGTDPESPEYWGEARAKDQRMVEMSPLSFAVALKPDVFYNVSLTVYVVIHASWERLLSLVMAAGSPLWMGGPEWSNAVEG